MLHVTIYSTKKNTQENTSSTDCSINNSYTLYSVVSHLGQDSNSGRYYHT